MSDLYFTPALDLAAMVKAKEISPVELVELFARRIDELNPALGAYFTVSTEQALEDARRAEADLGAGDLPRFFGVPIPIKDLNDTAGIRTTHGSAGFATRVPQEDDAVVQKLKRAGFIVHGKTATPEFGTTPWTESPGFEPARNPWDTERTPGGSSGGAAAAVAAGLCAVAHGSDGGGSIRIPSAACGVFGIKPSRGRVSAAPSGQSFLAQSGPIARTVADAAALLDEMCGYVTGDAYWAPPPERPFLEEVGRPPGALRIAFTSVAATGTDVHPEHVKATERAAALCEELGHQVTEAVPPWPDGLQADFVTLWCVGRAATVPAPPRSEWSPLNRTLAEIGDTTSAPDYLAASGRIQAAARRLVAFFDDYDVLLTPTVAGPPPRVREFVEDDNPLAEFFAAGRWVPFTPPWNTTGQPAVSVPWDLDSSGLPIGVQFVGPPAGEALLVRLASQIESARPWAHRRPSVVA